MMYNNKLAVAIKHNGKVLRENSDTVIIPFGNEYSIFIKNMNTVRALVSISIDGRDVGDGSEFVIYPNSTFEIERFLQNGNNHEGNRFKFIERTGAVEQHRGIGVEDGLIRVEFKYEKPVQWYYNYDAYNKPRSKNPWDSGILRGAGDWSGGNTTIISSNSASFNADAPQASYTHTSANVNQVQDAIQPQGNVQPANENGITVEGSISKQQFRTVASFPTESQSHVIVLKMLGETEDNVQVTRAVTVDRKPTCKTCGRKNKATAKFCTECGTSLQIVA